MSDTEVRRVLARQCYFDLAGICFAGDEGGSGQLAALVKGYGIGHDRFLYGSDFPFTPAWAVKNFAVRMKDGLEDLFGEEERRAIYEGNAIKLLSG